MIDCTNKFLMVACHDIGLHPTGFAQSIFDVKDGLPIAGAIFEGYNTVSIEAHLWIKSGHKPSKEWFAAICDYPFNQLEVVKVLGRVEESNVEARKLNEHLGYVIEARITNFSPEGDLLIYSITKEQSRILNSPKWERVLKLVGEM